MKYWLFKSEPSEWSWQAQKEKGSIGEPWDGVRNYQANNYMKEMSIGDLGFLHHSVKEKRIVGIIEIIKTYETKGEEKGGKTGRSKKKDPCHAPENVHLRTAN